MKKFFHLLKRVARREEGVTAIEYGLLAALIALVLAVGAGALGVGLNDIFSAIAGYVQGKAAGVSALP